MTDAPSDKHSESDGDEEVFHDARFPPDEEAVGAHKPCRSRPSLIVIGPIKPVT